MSAYANARDDDVPRSLPSTDALRQELGRMRRAARSRRMLAGILGAVLVVMAVGALVATLVFPVLQVFGSSMEPTLSEGDFVVCLRTSDFSRGDLAAFYYNNKVLIKRVIGLPGEQVLINEAGDVYVNGELLQESYVQDKALGDCDLTFPFEVPEGRLFVMGDHRATSVDSRNSVIGCVGEDNLVGRLVVTAWPPTRWALLG